MKRKIKKRNFVFAVLLVFLLALCSCADGDIDELLDGNNDEGEEAVTDTTGTEADTTAPTVTPGTPAHNAAGVAVNTTVTAVFSETMDDTTVTDTTLLVNDGVSNVAGTVTYSDLTATFTPTANLAYSTTYTVTILSTVADLAGNAMVTNASWSFTTSSDSETFLPTVSSVMPEDGATDVAINTTVTATYEVIDAVTLAATTFVVNDGVSDIPGTVSYSGTTATFTPDSDLEYNTTYTATITASVIDSGGNTSTSSASWSFTTGAEADTTAPTVSLTSPANAATEVAVNTVITATFSETMDGATIAQDTFIVNDGTSDIAGTVTYSDTTATFTPSANLAYGTTYTVTILSTVTDLAGNAMSANASWSFTTFSVLETTVLNIYSAILYDKYGVATWDPVTSTLVNSQSGISYHVSLSWENIPVEAGARYFVVVEGSSNPVNPATVQMQENGDDYTVYAKAEVDQWTGNITVELIPDQTDSAAKITFKFGAHAGTYYNYSATLYKVAAD